VVPMGIKPNDQFPFFLRLIYNFLMSAGKFLVSPKAKIVVICLFNIDLDFFWGEEKTKKKIPFLTQERLGRGYLGHNRVFLEMLNRNVG